MVGDGASPELRTQGLFRDRFIGVVRAGHSLSLGEMTAERFAAGGHVAVSRRGMDKGPVDEALAQLNLQRHIVTSVAGFSTALALARATDLIATIPAHYTESLRTGMHSFELPISLPPFTVAMLWHPRMDADPVHRWLRGCVREVCGQ